MKISVIVPTYNKLPRLKLMLCSIKLQKLPKELYEVIIVDDGSMDGTDQYMQNIVKEFDLKYVRLKSNMGRSAARNTGIEISTGNVIVFTDDDCILAPDYLINLIKGYTEGVILHGAIFNLPYLKFFSDPEKGILYPEFSNHHIDNLYSKCISEEDIVENFDKIKRMGKLSKFEKTVRQAILDPEPVIPWIGFTGGNVAVDVKMFKEAGGFDEALGKEWGAEDIELGYRLYQKGASFQYNMETSVYHMAHYRADSAQLSQKAIIYMSKKHKELGRLNLYDNFFDGNFDYIQFKERM